MYQTFLEDPVQPSWHPPGRPSKSHNWHTGKRLYCLIPNSDSYVSHHKSPWRNVGFRGHLFIPGSNNKSTRTVTVLLVRPFLQINSSELVVAICFYPDP